MTLLLHIQSSFLMLSSSLVSNYHFHEQILMFHNVQEKQRCLRWTVLLVLLVLLSYKANQSTSLLNFPDMVHNLDVEPKRKTYKRSSTGYRGLTKKSDGTFSVRIGIGNGKQKSLGTFVTAIQAALAYDQAAIKAGKKQHTLNFPDGLPIKQESDLDDSEGFWV